jgi:hypothetical protein
MKKLAIIAALYFCTASLFAQETKPDSVPPKPVTDTVTKAPPPPPAATTAQEEPSVAKQKMTCIRAGWQNSNLVSGDANSKNTLNSFYVGINRKIKLISILKLETGVEYMIAGAEFDNDTKVKLQYVGVPINLSVKIGPVYAIGGVTANWMVHQDVTVGGQSANDGNNVKDFDWTSGIGLGVDILMFSVEARYYYGLSEVIHNSHNSFVQAGFRFNF